MKIITAIAGILIMATSYAPAQNYSIDKYVIGGGGGEMSSTGYSVNGTVGQPVIGPSSSTGYVLNAGFWTGGGATGGSGCDYAVGDVNNSGGYNGLDITYGVNFFKGGSAPPYECECTPGNTWFVSGDVNSSCSYNGLDITYGVNYFKGGSGPIPCSDCPPVVIASSLAGKELPVASFQTEQVMRLNSRGKSQDIRPDIKGEQKEANAAKR